MKKIFVELRKDGGKTVKKTWALERDKTYTIGRQKERADILIEEVSISRAHAQIKVANGTFVDDKQVGKNQIVLLRAGVQIVLGQCKDTLYIREEVADEEEEAEEEEEVEVEAKPAEKRKARKASSEEAPEAKSPERSRSRNEEKKAPVEPAPTRPMPTVRLPPPKATASAAPALQIGQSGADDKKKLLWGARAGPSNSAKTYINHAISTNDEESGKFLKMLGVKEDMSQMQEKKAEADKKAPVKKQEIAQMNQELEKQFYSGLQRKDGRKNGLGFGN